MALTVPLLLLLLKTRFVDDVAIPHSLPFFADSSFGAELLCQWCVMNLTHQQHKVVNRINEVVSGRRCS